MEPVAYGKRILCLDFDGVLHWYRNGWKGADVIDDEPVPGAVEFMWAARQWFEVVVFSARCHQEGGIEAMTTWMQRHGFPKVRFVTEKPAAFLTIDDRALTFTGTWWNPEELWRGFKTWTGQDV
jgi:hypothetical protein